MSPPPPPAAVWKPPPNGHPKYPAAAAAAGEAARLSPDSGRGSDRTGSDTSNSYSDKSDQQAKQSHLPHSKQLNNLYPSMHQPQQQQFFPAPAYRSVV